MGAQTSKRFPEVDREALQEIHGSHSERQREQLSQPCSACCTPTNATGVEIIGEAPALAKYFQDDYDNGHIFDHEAFGYDFGYNVDLQVPAMIHKASGILVAENALDLREGDGPAAVLFHFTSIEIGRKIMHAVTSDNDALEALRAITPLAGQTGSGIVAMSKSPEQLRSKTAVLTSIYWPHAGRQGSEHLQDLLLNGGGLGSSPDDPRNEAVVDAILTDDRFCDKADCCIPILVSKSCVKYGTEDSPFGLEDIEGLPHPDVHLIVLSNSTLQTEQDDGAATISSTLSEKRFDNMQKRVDHLELTVGPNSAEAMLALGVLAATLRSAGHDAEAAALQRNWLQKSAMVYGLEHEYTLIAMGNLALTLRQMRQLDAAERLCRRRMEAAKRSLGMHHPGFSAAVRGLERTLRDMGREAEALELAEVEACATAVGAKTLLGGEAAIKTVMADADSRKPRRAALKGGA